MKQKIIFIFALSLVLTGFNGENRIVEQSSVNFQERILVTGVPACIIEGLQDVMVNEGQHAVFTAKVVPEDVSIRWTRNDEFLESGDKYDFSFEKGKATLTIKNVTKGDTGIYGIEVENSDGSDSSYALLSVILLNKKNI